jgi:hypothetical protein
LTNVGTVDNRLLKGRILLQLADLYRSRNAPDRAAEYLDQAIALFQDLPEPSLVASLQQVRSKLDL